MEKYYNREVKMSRKVEKITVEQAKQEIFNAQNIICKLLNELEYEIGGTIEDVDVSIRELAEEGSRIPFVKINFKLGDV